ncbi:MAG TPA: hypothetical protein VFK24_10400 [Gammaproteobacteria bacterium]|nr:hypothetical protein [Gammaproteobacteria bacterium]
MNLPHFLDFEASGLHPDSYPIEVAWSLPDGRIETRLIQPHEDWTHWDANAEAMHGISRGELTGYGRPIAEVATAMNAALAGCTVYTDAVDYDRFWAGALFSYADAKPTFDFADIQMLFTHLRLPHDTRYELERLSFQRAPRPLHRAGNDVRRLQIWYELAVGAERANAKGKRGPTYD